MKIVHAADLHIDSPLRGLTRYEGAPIDDIRGATRRALSHLVDLCLDEGADALLLAGDLFDGDWRDYSTGLFFAAQLGRLRDIDIAVYMIRGNHDAASKLTRHIQLPAHCRELATGRPETIIDEARGLAVHGQGYATRAVTSDLAAAYPERISDLFNVGLLHTSLDGREGHEPYAPTSAAMLGRLGYDYWALGHVHQREIVSREPWIVFPGNLQGRHARECGPKGATVIEVEDGRVAQLRAETLDVVRWAHLRVDLSPAEDTDDALQCCVRALEDEIAQADGRLLAARIELQGASNAHAALARDPETWQHELRVRSFDLAGEGLWIERIRQDTRSPTERSRLAEREDALGQIVASLDELRRDPDGLQTLAGELDDLAKVLPAELRQGVDGLSFESPLAMGQLLDEVEHMLVARLVPEDTD